MPTMKRAKILSASAGSGKTFQLAYKYIRDVIERPELYHNILAVTFTNKATEEMKSRILREIHTLATGQKSPYTQMLIEELGVSEAMVRKQALNAQTLILHNYSRFTILTIDRFFQRIIRAFIRELGIDLNYNLEIDPTMLLTRSADTLIEKIAQNEELKHWLLEFAEERINDGTRWDMRGDLCSLGKEIFKERIRQRMKLKQSKAELRDIVNNLSARCKKAKDDLTACAEDALAIMAHYGVSHDMFKGASSSFVGYFKRYATGDMKEPTATMLKAIDDIDAWYTKSANANVREAAIELQPYLKRAYELYNIAIKQINTTKLIRENYRSFALLTDLHDEITDICDKENIMLLGQTKGILSTLIDNSNTPFIYEKVGNRFERFMIDEFQDTSVSEWDNMLPLLQNAMASSDKCSVFIVGDVKQSIYRWRGGDWQLLQSIAQNDLGTEDVEIVHLKENYRSLGNIIKFNNSIISRVVEIDNHYLNESITAALKAGNIDNKLYTSLHNILERAYAEHAQEIATSKKEEGYARLSIYDTTTMDSPFIEAIEDAIKRGYRYSDILILVRGANDGQKVANQLFAYKEKMFTAEGKQGFNILTSDALTIESSKVTDFIIAVMRLCANPCNDIERGVYNRFLRLPFDHTFDDQERELLARISHLSPMEAFELIVSSYKLDNDKENIAFLQAMHEQVVSYSTSRNGDIQRYLKWWEERGKDDSISVEMTDNTIEITTIHKAKGLERPIVIIPYCKWDTTPRSALRSVVWASANKDAGEIANIGDMPVIYGSDMQNSSFTAHYYQEMVMSHVDAINLLYVALTRASEELYLYVPSRLNKKSETQNISSTAPLLTTAIKTLPCRIEEHSNELGHCMIEYHYGQQLAAPLPKRHDSASKDIILDNYISHKPDIKVRYPSSRYSAEGLKCGSSQQQYGIKLHSLFERADNEEQLFAAIRELENNAIIGATDIPQLEASIRKSLDIPCVKEWFNYEWDDIKREAEIISLTDIYRPDRVMIKGRKAIVVDYKFGEKTDNRYKQQVKRYIELLREMSLYDTIEGYVWYISLGEVVKVD